jgi:glycosyltransferase involved in cell wall biosynthesis
MVGPAPLWPRALAALREDLDLVGSVPRPEMARHYAWADVFVLPSLCEGSATACYEAMAAGLPVVATPNAGSVVCDGADGFIVPIRDVGALVARLALLAGDRERLREMSERARRRAAAFTLERYGERLLKALDGEPVAEVPA